MLKRLSVLMMVLVFAFAVVACGDDEEPAGGGETTTEETTPTEGTETTETPEATEEEPSDSGEVQDNPQVQAAVEQCKQAIQAQAQLSDDLKGELEDLCDKAASGDIKDAQEASVEVCKKIAEELVPDEATREQVIQQCEAAVAP